MRKKNKQTNDPKERKKKRRKKEQLIRSAGDIAIVPYARTGAPGWLAPPTNKPEKIPISQHQAGQVLFNCQAICRSQTKRRRTKKGPISLARLVTQTTRPVHPAIATLRSQLRFHSQ